MVLYDDLLDDWDEDEEDSMPDTIPDPDRIDVPIAGLCFAERL